MSGVINVSRHIHNSLTAMKKYTKEDFDKFEKDDSGCTICPTGDYTEIKHFPEGCSFAEWCSFGKGCSFENKGKAKPGYPFMAFVGAVSRKGSKVYFFNLEIGIYVRCECYHGTIEEFRDRVKTQKADPLYLDFAELAEKKFTTAKL